MTSAASTYWNFIAERYQAETRISCEDFHYGPLLPGDRELQLLPGQVNGLDCLELGCGAGQNSIFLASRGARCVALDCAFNQLKAGAHLARRHGADVHFLQADMAVLPLPDRTDGLFDMIHSAYALPFARNQQAVIAAAGARLRPGGWLVCSTAHPLSTAERIELEDGQRGVFVGDYYSPPADVRSAGGGTAHCRPVPISRVAQWMTGAGLYIEALLEPKPLDVCGMSQRERQQRIPYDSPAWRGQYAELNRIPAVVVYIARKQ